MSIGRALTKEEKDLDDRINSLARRWNIDFPNESVEQIVIKCMSCGACKVNNLECEYCGNRL